MQAPDETRSEITGGEILMVENKLCEVVSYVDSGKVVFMRPLKEEDKDKCPHCNKPIPTEIDIVEGCSNWNEKVRKVKTI